MKLFKKSFSLLAVAALCLGFFFSNAVTVSAAEPVTYYVKYVDSLSAWRVQEGTWSDSAFHSGLEHVTYNIKDGDTIVIDGTQGINLNVDVQLKNLTLVGTNIALVTAKSFEDVYVLSNTTAAINGDVKNAYVFDDCKVNFNNNVVNLNLASTKGALSTSDVNVLGTVDYLHSEGPNYSSYTFYSFQANSLKIIAGVPYADEGKFSRTAPATTPSTSTNTNTNKDYDDVPKTGDDGFMNPFLLVAIAAVCAFGAYKLNK